MRRCELRSTRALRAGVEAGGDKDGDEARRQETTQLGDNAGRRQAVRQAPCLAGREGGRQ